MTHNIPTTILAFRKHGKRPPLSCAYKARWRAEPRVRVAAGEAAVRPVTTGWSRVSRLLLTSHQNRCMKSSALDQMIYYVNVKAFLSCLLLNMIQITFHIFVKCYSQHTVNNQNVTSCGFSSGISLVTSQYD